VTIRFLFDYISPNAYLAWTQLPALAVKYGCDVEPVPVLFAGLLADGVGLSGHALVAAAESAESKSRLRAQTDAAIARGVFGVPTMEVRDELFWGYDDFPQLELVLAGEEPPVDGAAWRQWSPPPASAERRRR